MSGEETADGIGVRTTCRGEFRGVSVWRRDKEVNLVLSYGAFSCCMLTVDFGLTAFRQPHWWCGHMLG